MPAKLLRHLKAVRKRTSRYVVERHIKRTETRGKVDKLRRSWRWACEQAGLGEDVTPHTLRHTSVTWRLHAGVSIWDTADYVGMSEKMVREHYGRSHPDYQKSARDAI